MTSFTFPCNQNDMQYHILYMIEFIKLCVVNVSFTLVFEFVTEIGHVDDADIERLPDPVPQWDFRPISLPYGGATYIAFDLETTDSKHPFNTVAVFWA